MDKLTFYGTLIKQTLTDYETRASRHLQDGVEGVVVFDDEHYHYLWLQAGWSRHRRVHGVTVHVRLRNEQIWIEQDWTEDGIVTDLVLAGVPRDDIVLAFHEHEQQYAVEHSE